MRLGLLWAALLKATRATLLTFRSGSFRVVRKCPISALSNWSMCWGWSEIVNFMAVTTVVLIRAEGEFKDAFSFGRRASGDIKHSFPRHSATTFLVPSSTHSVCLYLMEYEGEIFCQVPQSNITQGIAGC